MATTTHALLCLIPPSIFSLLFCGFLSSFFPPLFHSPPLSYAWIIFKSFFYQLMMHSISVNAITCTKQMLSAFRAVDFCWLTFICRNISLFNECLLVKTVTRWWLWSSIFWVFWSAPLLLIQPQNFLHVHLINSALHSNNFIWQATEPCYTNNSAALFSKEILFSFTNSIVFNCCKAYINTRS